MKSKFLLLLPLLSACTVSAQLTVTSGAEFLVNGDIALTLQNIDLVNNGILAGGVNTTSFTGDASSSISGVGTLRFFQLKVNKTGNQSVILQKNIDVVNGVVFTSGFFDLNGFNVDLETTGHIEGENNNTRFIGANGGQVLLRTALNAPSNANPGNLGIQITSTQDLGQVTIKRGHQSQGVNAGAGTSILRFYDILPANNNDLDATLRFNYFDGELNGIDENSLVLFKSDDAVNWSAQGFTSKDASSNFVEKNGITSFSRWTLSTIISPLTVLFTSFNVNCEGNSVVITWKTAQEQNSDHFNVEKSPDGIHWSVAGNLPAVGNSSVETRYSFTDNNPVPNDFYRIAEYDLDGTIHYTGTIKSSCNTTDDFKLWPNPVNDKLFINILASTQYDASIRLFDSKGALVKIQRASISQGSNQLSVDMKSLPVGIYQLSVNSDNGQLQKTVRVMKR